jgi:hypothetical protein
MPGASPAADQCATGRLTIPVYRPYRRVLVDPPLAEQEEPGAQQQHCERYWRGVNAGVGQNAAIAGSDAAVRVGSNHAADGGGSLGAAAVASR